jgi:D-alanyl-D-alanine carboxypeptidase/D-alanyl-D-alanine-endopeptidase (penicillin-binding protein 4)
MVSAPQFRNAHWGVLIVDPEAGDTLYSLNAGKLFMPASNMKLVTGAVALAQLGAGFRFRTTVVAVGERRGGVLDGDLIVHGRGDPSFSDSMRADAMLPMLELADSIVARGIRRVTGRIIAGDDVFPDAAYGYGWSWDEFDESYSAGVDELFFNEGAGRVTVRAGARAGAPVVAVTKPLATYPRLRITARTVARPSTLAAGGSEPGAAVEPQPLKVAFDSTTGGLLVTGELGLGDSVSRLVAYRDQRGAFLAALSSALAARGITVAGGLRAPRPRPDTLFVYQSPTLAEILPTFQKPSQNQIGEILLKTLGLERAGGGRADSGRRVVDSQLVAWGAERDGFVVRDGSGLSRYNYLSPETIVRVLDVMRRHPDFRTYYDALPIAGIDGTIRTRMRGTPAEGNVHAKTGTLSNARSLSGYVTAADGRLLLFSLLCNNWTVPVREINAVQDAIAARLASLTRVVEAR